MQHRIATCLSGGGVGSIIIFKKTEYRIHFSPPCHYSADMFPPKQKSPEVGFFIFSKALRTWISASYRFCPSTRSSFVDGLDLNRRYYISPFFDRLLFYDCLIMVFFSFFYCCSTLRQKTSVKVMVCNDSISFTIVFLQEHI